MRRVANDAQLTAELILLVRMMFADGQMTQDEIDKFTQICESRFDIPAEDMAQVIQFLADFGYETTAMNAAGIFEDLDFETKRTLMRHMVQIAQSDDELDPRESLLLQRTADVLGPTMMDAFAPK